MHQHQAPESVRHRDAQTLGLTRRQLRGSTWRHPAVGTALRRDRGDDLAAACRAVQRVLPDHAVWTHATAAALRDWWLPSRLGSTPAIVSTDGGDPHLDRRGVYVRRVAVPPGHRTELDGIRISSPAWTIAELAEDLALIDLVVVIDCALHHGWCTVGDLWAVCVKGRRGVRTLRQAIALADGRSESAWETVLRTELAAAVPATPLPHQAQRVMRLSAHRSLPGRRRSAPEHTRVKSSDPAKVEELHAMAVLRLVVGGSRNHGGAPAAPSLVDLRQVQALNVTTQRTAAAAPTIATSGAARLGSPAKWAPRRSMRHGPRQPLDGRNRSAGASVNCCGAP